MLRRNPQARFASVLKQAKVFLHSRLDSSHTHERRVLCWATVRRELHISVLIFVVAFAGAFALRSVDGDSFPGLTATWFAPSAMYALGQGFQNVSVESVDPLFAEFLAHTGTFGPGEGAYAELPALSGPSAAKTVPLNYFHGMHPYLIYAVGLCWRFFGLSWVALRPLYGLLFAFTAVGAYATLRNGMGRTLSILFVSVFMTSPANLTMFASLRDYSKAPFILFTLALLLFVLTQRLTVRALCAAACVTGACIGVGLGFRHDLLICMFPAALTVGFLVHTETRWAIKARSLAISFLILGFVLPAAPVLYSTTAKGDSTSHHIIGGFAPLSDNLLRIESPDYRILQLFNDSYIAATITSYGHRVLGAEHEIDYCGPEYNEYGMKLATRILLDFPADIVTRSYASARQILTNGLSEDFPPAFSTHPVAEKVLRYTSPLAFHLSRYGLFYAVLALFIAGLRSARLALGLTFVFAFFLCYPAIQFHFRHYFHLAVVPLWLMGYVWTNVTRGGLYSLRRLAVTESQQADTGTQPVFWRVGRAVLLSACIILLGTSVLWTLRFYQGHKLARTIEDYKTFELRPIATSPEPMKFAGPAGTVFAARAGSAIVKGHDAEKYREVRTGYMAVRLLPSDTDTYLSIVYDSGSDYRGPLGSSPPIEAVNNFSVNVKLPTSREPYLYFFPVYDCDSTDAGLWRKFVGVGLHDTHTDKFQGLYAVDVLERLPILLNLRVPVDFSSDEVKVCERLRPMEVPPLVRGELARRMNLLPNGSFEELTDDFLPTRFQAPARNSKVGVVLSPKTDGAVAISQTWFENDAGMSIFNGFHAKLSGLKPRTKYDVFLSASNFSHSNVYLLTAWEVRDARSGSPKVNRLARVLWVPPADGFRPYYGSFTTGETKADYIVLNTQCVDNAGDFPASVLWDDWRVSEAIH